MALSFRVVLTNVVSALAALTRTSSRLMSASECIQVRTEGLLNNLTRMFKVSSDVRFVSRRW